MRFLMYRLGDESIPVPQLDPEQMEQMTKVTAEATKAGVLVMNGGIAPTAMGRKVTRDERRVHRDRRPVHRGQGARRRLGPARGARQGRGHRVGQAPAGHRRRRRDPASARSGSRSLRRQPPGRPVGPVGPGRAGSNSRAVGLSDWSGGSARPVALVGLAVGRSAAGRDRRWPGRTDRGTVGRFGPVGRMARAGRLLPRRRWVTAPPPRASFLIFQLFLLWSNSRLCRVWR